MAITAYFCLKKDMMQWSNNQAVQEEVALLVKGSAMFRMLYSLNRRKPYLSFQKYFSN